MAPPSAASVSIDNPGQQTVDGAIDVRGNDGSLLSSDPFSVPPGGKVDFTGLGGGGSGILSGWIQIFATGPLGAVLRFDLSGIGIAGIGTRTAERGVIIPVRRVGGLSTGVAYGNTTNYTIELTFTLKDESGTEVGTTTRDVVGNGHGSIFFHQLFPELDLGSFSGTLCVTTPMGGFAAEALELGVNAGEFTALPVTPLE